VEKKIRVAIHTLGCRLNQYESDGIVGSLLQDGAYEASEENADIAIVNTCTVTDHADAKNRNIIRGIIKKNPNARVIVTGCYAQTDPEKISEIPGVYLVVGNDRKSRLASIIQELSTSVVATASTAFLENPVKTNSEISHSVMAMRVPSNEAKSVASPGYQLPSLENPFAYGSVLPQGHTRAYMKIQDGCDRKCSYCKIPQARGRGVSRKFSEAVEEAQRLEDQGIPEIVLTGVNLGWYSDGSADFASLVEAVLSRLKHSRLRLSSIEPCDVNARLGELSLHPRFCNFLHVPLQSGSAEILKRMRRTYNPVSFRKRMETVLTINPEIFPGTDVITGFPGETEEDFQETLRICRDLSFANVHAFPFSPRKGTPAADMRGRPDTSIVRRRMEELSGVADRGWMAFAQGRIGKEHEVVIEKIQKQEFPETQFEYSALADNFLRFSFRAKDEYRRGTSIRLTALEILDKKTILGQALTQ